VLQFNIRFQGITQPVSGDIDLMLLSQPFTAGKQGHELALEFRHSSLVGEMNQFAERVATQRRAKELVDQTDEFLPGWLPLIALGEGEPLRRFIGHVEGGEEHLASIRRLLNTEELIAAIQPWERVFRAIICEEEKLVAVLGGVWWRQCCLVWSICRGTKQEWMTCRP
jgi:hypothetical protein